jgi:hypothetical protein
MPVVDASAGEAAPGPTGIPAIVERMSIDGQKPHEFPSDDGAIDLAVSTAIAYTGHVSPTESLLALKKQSADMKSAKKLLGSQIRNAKRKNKRLKDKAKNLSTDDLMTLWMAKGGGKQMKSEATAQSSDTGKLASSANISEVPGANAASSDNSAPVRMEGEHEEMEL